MSRELDIIDKQLLDLLQREVPLVDRPFEQIGREIGLAEDQVIERIVKLKRGPGPVIRQISAIFDSTALGYVSTLVAAKVDESQIEQAAAEISKHPGVSHNYRREHAYNLWYTLAVPPDSSLGLAETVEELHRRSGAIATRIFPTLKLFKIGVRLNLAGGPDAPATGRRHSAVTAPLSARDKRMIRALQQDMPIVPRPFAPGSDQAGVTAAEFLAAAGDYQRRNLMRRFAAVLHHREVGFSANGMGVWAVPHEFHDLFGSIAASFPEVSHCYLRPTYLDWPYSIFTMVHATTPHECQSVLDRLSRTTGVKDYSALFSTHEFKKTRVQYFTPDIEAWEREVTRAARPCFQFAKTSPGRPFHDEGSDYVNKTA